MWPGCDLRLGSWLLRFRAGNCSCISLAITTGARAQGILEAKWDQVDLGANPINYDPLGRDRTSKGRVTVPLNNRALAAIKQAHAAAQSDRVIEYGGQGISNLRWAIKRAAERSGVPCSPHVFRHTADALDW